MKDIESFDVTEVPGIVGDQPQPVRSRRRRNPCVVHGDGPRAALATDGSPFPADFAAERDHDVVAYGLAQHCQSRPAPSATVRALIQFPNGHEGNREGVSFKVRAITPCQPVPPHQIRHDVGVEHECTHRSFSPPSRSSGRRSWIPCTKRSKSSSSSHRAAAAPIISSSGCGTAIPCSAANSSTVRFRQNCPGGTGDSWVSPSTGSAFAILGRSCRAGSIPAAPFVALITRSILSCLGFVPIRSEGTC